MVLAEAGQTAAKRAKAAAKANLFIDIPVERFAR
jgi:hypothetical protein